jgi:hypothetical protein
VGSGLKRSAVLLAVLGLMAMSAGNAAASTSGEITTAMATPDWLHGDFAGSATWGGCAPLPPGKGPKPERQTEAIDLGPEAPTGQACRWTPYATLGPGSSIEDCSSANRHLQSLGPDVHLVWKGETKWGAGTSSFEATGLSLDGIPGEVFCLAAVEEVPEETKIPCVPPDKPMPIDWHCPYVIRSYDIPLDARLVEVMPEPAKPAPEAGTGQQAAASPPIVKPHHRRCRGKRKAHHRHVGKRCAKR